jgi:hypothetical protein
MIKTWDVFISHASEDKAEVVLPLARLLRAAGVKVWLDEHELKIGDSISQKIDAGLAESRFGVVVLSERFFAKHWPKKELAGLRAIEEDGQKVILPVWHKVDKVAVASRSPILADLLAASTANGIEKVARHIVDCVFAPGSGSPSKSNPSVSRSLIELLQQNPTKPEFMHFVRAHYKYIAHVMHTAVEPLWAPRIGDCAFDAAAIGNVGTTRGQTLELALFLPIWSDPFSHKSTRLRPALSKAMTNAHALVEQYEAFNAEQLVRPRGGTKIGFPQPLKRNAKMNRTHTNLRQEQPSVEWIIEQLHSAEPNVPKRAGRVITPTLHITIFAGRRHLVDRSEGTAQSWRTARMNMGRPVSLRTYDGLLDEFQEIEKWQAHSSTFALGSFSFGDRED